MMQGLDHSPIYSVRSVERLRMPYKEIWFMTQQFYTSVANVIVGERVAQRRLHSTSN